MLEVLGLRNDEEYAYLRLLDRGPAGAAELAVDGRTVAAMVAALAELERRGLVHRTSAEPARYALVDPEIAVEAVISERRRELQLAQRVLAELAGRYRHETNGRSAGAVEVIDEPLVALARWREAHGTATEQVRALERPPYGEPPSVPNPVELQLLAAEVRHRVVYDQTAVDIPGRLADLRAGLAAGEEARVLPSLPCRLLVIDDRLAMLPGRTGAMINEQLLVVPPGGLLDALIALFEATWARAMPLRLTSGAPDATADGSAEGDDGVILGLLAAGLTDHAIARQLGTSERTVQRRIQRLTQRLGARTRFQAGLQAGRQRWL